MEDQATNKIENEIFEEIKNKVNNCSSKEAEKIIEDEVRKRNYLSEDWNVYYAVRRIKEKTDKLYCKKIKMPFGEYVISFIFGASLAWSFGFSGFIPCVLGTIFAVWLKRKMSNSKTIFVKYLYWIIFVIVILVGLLVRGISQDYR